MKNIFAITLSITQSCINFFYLFLGKYTDRKYIISSYAKSDSKYQSSKPISISWTEIFQGIEVSVQISTSIHDSPSRIAVRNKSGTVMEEVTIVVEVEGYFDGNFSDKRYIAQQILVFCNVNCDPKIKSLSEIPPINFSILEDGNPISSYQNFSISLISLYQNGNKKTVNQQPKEYDFSALLKSG